MSNKYEAQADRLEREINATHDNSFLASIVRAIIKLLTPKSL